MVQRAYAGTHGDLVLEPSTMLGVVHLQDSKTTENPKVPNRLWEWRFHLWGSRKKFHG
jgi:hypothetical protein